MSLLHRPLPLFSHLSLAFLKVTMNDILVLVLCRSKAAQPPYEIPELHHFLGVSVSCVYVSVVAVGGGGVCVRITLRPGI